MSVKSIESFAEFQKIVNSGKPVLVDFWAEWCAPCKAMLPVFEEMSKAGDGVEFYKVNIDRLDDVAQEVGIRTVREIPAFMLFKDGNKLGEHVGAHPSRLEGLLAEGKSLL